MNLPYLFLNSTALDENICVILNWLDHLDYNFPKNYLNLELSNMTQSLNWNFLFYILWEWYILILY